MSNQTGIGEKLKSYLKHPGSFIVMLLVILGAIITSAVFDRLYSDQRSAAYQAVFVRVRIYI
mgnify:CR=1 FL=1